jgi:D-alanyl-D-alanine carboxypeptidase
MKVRYGAGCLLIGACLLLTGCASSDGATLLTYREQMQKDTYSSTQAIFRKDGLTSGICVISDESQFDPDEIQASAAVLFNTAEKETIYSKSAYEHLPVASLTKLMTALLVLKYGDLDQTVTLGDEVVIQTYDAWLCGFEPGDQVTLRDLLRAALVYSGNDAANAAAVGVSGSLDAFVTLMNQEAARLGATDTHFANPNGLDQNGHYSTAYDLYLIFNECLKYPEFRQIIPMTSVTVSYVNAEQETVTKTFTSGNGYLNQTAVPPSPITAIGGKTGHTETAGYCLATLAKDASGDEYIAIVLGAETKQQVYAQTNLLFEKIP